MMPGITTYDTLVITFGPISAIMKPMMTLVAPSQGIHESDSTFPVAIVYSALIEVPWISARIASHPHVAKIATNQMMTIPLYPKHAR